MPRRRKRRAAGVAALLNVLQVFHCDTLHCTIEDDRLASAGSAPPTAKVIHQHWLSELGQLFGEPTIDTPPLENLLTKIVIKRGSRWTVSQNDEEPLTIQDANGQKLPLTVQQSKYFDFFNQSEIGVSKGDNIRITRNGFEKQEKQLNNGMTLEVAEITTAGKIVLSNKVSKAEFELDQEFGLWSHAYCITSHASQGKTVDEVFIAQPASTFGATDLKQFYVSESRGTNHARIYADDSQALVEYARKLVTEWVHVSYLIQVKAFHKIKYRE